MKRIKNIINKTKIKKIDIEKINIRKIVLHSASIVVVLLFGIGMGMQMSSGQAIPDRNSATNNSESIQSEAVNENAKIVVVNEDTGVEASGEHINYAEVMINASGEEYQIVSKKMAEEGLASGEYDAVVTFPSDFSKNIVSINDDNPKSSTLSLDITDGLSKEKYIDVYKALISFEGRVNGSVASAYVESIYKELHLAQDEVSQVLKNEENSIEVVKEVTMDNYAEQLDLGELPTVTFEPASADVSEIMTEAGSTISDVKNIYIESYKQAKEDYSRVVSELDSQSEIISNQTIAWNEELDEWELKIEGVAREDRELLITWREGANSVISDINSSVESLNASAEALRDNSIDVIDVIDDYNTDLEAFKEWHSYLTEYKQYLSEYKVYLEGGMTGNEPAAPSTPTSDLPDTISYSEIRENISNAIIEMEDAKNDLNDIIDNGGIEDLPELSGDSPQYVDTDTDTDEEDNSRPEMPTELSEALTKVTDTVNSYDAEKYLNEETDADVNEKVTSFNDEISKANEAISEANTKNIETMTEAYTGYNTYVADLRENVVNTHDAEIEGLNKNLGLLEQSLENTSKSNHELMDSFVNRLPNSRDGSMVNSSVVNTTVTPVKHYSNSSYSASNSDNLSIKADTISKENNSNTMWMYVILVLIGVLVAIDIRIAYVKKKER